MNQKFTLMAFSILDFSNSKKAKGYYSFTPLILGMLLGLAFLPTNLFSNSIHQVNFASKTVLTFNKKVKANLANVAIEDKQISSLEMLAPCPGGSGVIGGKSFPDYNYNGIDDQVGQGIAGIEVHIYGCDASGNSQSMGSTTTDENGAYFFSALTDGSEYRVEFIIPAALSYLQSGFNGSDSRTSVQFITAPSCAVNIGLVNPADFCEADPSLAIPCYVNGDPLTAGSGSADEEALVMFKTSFEGSQPKPTLLATAEQIGATWGTAYQRSSKRLFTSAMLKRHVGLGPLGLGGIYQVDLNGAQPIVSGFIDVASIGINVGSYPSNSARGLSANVNLPSNDSQAFVDVGKKGLGGLCMSEDGSKLYVVNLTEKKLHSINIDGGTPTSNDVQSYTLPNPGCSGGAFRPFGVRMNNGNIYVGGVCDAESSGNKSDLSAIVYRLDGSSFTEVLNYSLDYTKGLASRSCDNGGWFPWVTQLPANCFMSGSSNVIVHPTPQLTALEFDAGGNMIMGFTDRMGNQLGFQNFAPTGTTETYTVFTGGDILKAGSNHDGSFTIENNGSVNGQSTAGVGNNEGPGGGEFYYWDVYDIAPNIPRPHSETAQGGLALVKGTGDVISTALDPFGTTVNSGGVNYFNNQTGAVRDPGYRVFRSSSSSLATFSKANGLGDLVALCGEAPLQIGGRLWVDANENGIQDPCEEILSGIAVSLYNSNGTAEATTNTDANGEYYFGELSGNNQIAPNSDYYVVIGEGGQFNGGALLDSLFLTSANIGMGSMPDLNDSDAQTAGNSILGGAISGFPNIKVTTGGIGAVSHDNDAGFIVDVVQPTADISGFVWNDLNENGLQNTGELGISGVNVALYTNQNVLVNEMTTNGSGNYLFENVLGNDYYLVFDASNDPTAGDNFAVTLQDIGSDENVDSDIDQSTERVDFTFEPLNGDVEYDAGYTLPVAPITGFVFNDQDKDGLQGNNEPGIGGVKISLFNATGNQIDMTNTDPNGNYLFDNIMEGNYYVVVDISTNAAGNNDFQGTIQDAGDDDFDSDVNPNTGQSNTFNHDPATGNSDIDAGYFEQTAAISGFVWYDLNENGLQNAGENGIPGVRVNLLNGNGILVGTTNTDANGNYDFTEVKTDNYSLTFDASNDPVAGDNFEITLQDIGSDENLDSDISQNDGSVDFSFDANDGTAEYDAGYTLPLGSIMGLAFDDENRNGLQGNNEPLIPGVEVTLYQSNGNQIGTTTTDGNGGYIFNEIMEGAHYVIFDISTNTNGIDNYVGTTKDAGDDDFDSDVDPNTGRTDNFNFDPSAESTTYDAGYYVGTGKITGTAFSDLNENGLQDTNEPGIPGVDIMLIGSNGIAQNSTVTNGNGYFEINDVSQGTYTVLFNPDVNTAGLDNLTPTIKDVNNNQNDDLDSDINPNNEVDPFDFDPLVGKDVDGGFIEPVDPVMIGDLVFKDCNGNGIQEADEGGIPNIPVTLSGTNDIGESVRMEMTTNSMGIYTFTVERPGTYSVDFDLPEGVTGLEFSPKGQGGDRDRDSDVNTLSGASDAITLRSGERNLSIDAGLVDVAPPVIFNVPPDVTVDCNDIPSPPSSIKAVDNCDPSVDVTFSERVINAGSCPYIIERTWSAVDGCGNEANRTQQITVTDTEAPVITIVNPLLIGLENGGEVIFECDNLPQFDANDVIATDDCSDVDVKFVDLIREQGNCVEDGYIVKMTCGWIAEDDCGNKSEFNIVIFVVDTKSPTLTNVPEDLTINLDQGQFIPPVPNTVYATDNCDEYVRVEFSETKSNGVCGYEILRTWTGYDDCGNKAVETQKLTLLEDCTCPDELVSNTLVWDAACDGSVGGMINLDLTADLNKYDISISPNIGNISFVGNRFTDLPPGDYTVTVNYNAAGECSETYNFTINTATPSTIKVATQTRADCNTENGSVSLTPTNFTYNWSDGGTGAQRNDLAAGSYIVTFTDANNCQGSQAIIIENPDGCECIDFEAKLLWEIMPTCNGYTNGQVDIEIIGGTPPYTYLWHDGQTTKDLFGVTGGPYSLTATDANGCIATLTGNLGQPDPITITETLMNGDCGEKGMIDIYVTGGTAPYSYLWNNGATTEDLSNLVSGEYSVTVTDANRCTGNLTINISNSGSISVSLNSNHPGCADLNNGSISAMVTGGQNPLTYEWSNGASTSSIDNLGTGTYAVMVTDAAGCKAMAEVTLRAPDLFTLALSPSDPICGGETGGIDITISGGQAPFTYSWSNGANSQNIQDIDAGNYGVTVTDANGCVNVGNATVIVFTRLSATAHPNAPSCSDENGSITLDLSGGRSPYSYLWSNGMSSKDLTNIAPGSYSVTITDANGCTSTISTEINTTAGIAISETLSHPTCVGVSGGSIDIRVTGGTAPYTYSWTSGHTTEDINDLMPGGYSVVVTDANGCQFMKSFILDNPTAILVTSEVDAPDCADDFGKINITVNGGTAPYTFNWSNGANTEDLNNIPQGDYSVTVIDANGCTHIADFNLVAPSPLLATSEVVDQDCSGDGNINLTVSGGTPPYNYLWSNGATTEDLSKVGGGTYSVVISDANDCKLSHEVTVQSTGGIEILVSGAAPTCPGATDGSLSLDVKGGTLPYSYAWSDGSQAAGLVNIPAGSYDVTVTDAKGCSLVGLAVLDPAPAITASVVATNPNCSYETGRIDLTATDGVGNLSFAWSNGATTEDIDGLVPGIYAVTITDENGCSETTSAEITSPSAIDIALTPINPGCGSTTGSINLTVSGGTPPYTYSWSNGSFDQNIAGVAAGTYFVTVTDANGCQQDGRTSIENVPNITAVIAGTNNPTCANAADGSIQIEVGGGTSPYTYNWSNGATDKDLNNLTAGTYSVIIQDARGCEIILSATLQSPEVITFEILTTNPNCPGETGNIDITVSGGTAPYSYHWNNDALSEDLSNVVAGNYQLTVRDANGCQQVSENITIVDPNEFSLSLDPTNIQCYGQSNGSILLSVSGSGVYTYNWSNGMTSQNLANLAVGSYSVTVTNEKGCQKITKTEITMPPAISLGMTFSNPQCPNDFGAINIEVEGGTPPYTYAWNNGATSQNVADLIAGRYTVVVTDARGCTLEGSANIQAATQITANIEATNLTCAGNDGAINLSVSGGSGNYSYLWSNGANSQNLSNVAPGNYTVTITDTKGCFITASTIVADECLCPNPLVNQNMVTNARCGEANGSIMIMVTGDIDFYQFQWSPDAGNPGTYNNERTDLSSGTYDVTVSYANKPECTEVIRLSVGNRDGVAGEVIGNIPADCGQNNGRVTLAPSVSYFWEDGSESKNRGNLAPGVYLIRTLDGSGCEGSLTVSVSEEPCPEPCTLEAAIANMQAPDCNGNLGSIEVEITGGTAPYTFEWSLESIGNIANPTGLAEGDYSVVITDASGCNISLMASLSSPDCGPDPDECNLQLSLMAFELSCDGANDGSVGVNVFNGTAPYTYNWSNGASGDRLENLAAGEYWVEVIDANGCRETAKIDVKSPGRLVISEVRTVVDCEGVEIRLNVSGGKAPYSWVCDGLSGSLLDPLNLIPGTYECIVTDGAGCSVMHTLVIEDYQPLSVVGEVKNASCGQEDGSIDLTPSGGTAPYTFEWDCGLYGDEDQFNLGAHTYNVTVTDATNCFVVETYTIEECSGESFGFISIEAVSIGEQKVKLNWETENENMEGNFVVQHSQDRENFETIGQAMAGQGPISTANYEMEEAANLGMNYFRIKYINNDGDEFLSEIAEVNVFLSSATGRTGITAIVYPNPTVNSFILDFAEPIQADITVTITDMEGVVLEKKELAPGTPKQEFDVTSYNSGVYNITLQQRRKKLRTYRLIKAVE